MIGPLSKGDNSLVVVMATCLRSSHSLSLGLGVRTGRSCSP